MSDKLVSRDMVKIFKIRAFSFSIFNIVHMRLNKIEEGFTVVTRKTVVPPPDYKGVDSWPEAALPEAVDGCELDVVRGGGGHGEGVAAVHRAVPRQRHLRHQHSPPWVWWVVERDPKLLVMQNMQQQY